VWDRNEPTGGRTTFWLDDNGDDDDVDDDGEDDDENDGDENLPFFEEINEYSSGFPRCFIRLGQN
jgi:hypothetical protein